MTYCVGLRLKTGLVMLADTRTNAGVDNIATFGKLHLFEAAGERVIMLAASGNLAITQSVFNLVSDGFESATSGKVESFTPCRACSARRSWSARLSAASTPPTARR